MFNHVKTWKLTIFVKFWSKSITCNLVILKFERQNPQIPPGPSNTRKSLKNDDFMSDSERENRGQKVANGTKITKITKFLNHVFKTSKKTLSYSRTYCKIYKIENIGKIGQSRVGLMAKRVIYYGSTRSTSSTPLTWKLTPHFSRWFSKSGKKSNYHFWGFLSQKWKSSTFARCHFKDFLSVTLFR